MTRLPPSNAPVSPRKMRQRRQERKRPAPGSRRSAVHPRQAVRRRLSCPLCHDTHLRPGVAFKIGVPMKRALLLLPFLAACSGGSVPVASEQRIETRYHLSDLSYIAGGRDLKTDVL